MLNFRGASGRSSLLAVVWPILLVALVGRALLLATGAVSLHSDESIVGLMARHILQGERPTFFYGQAYMGSLDAWLIAVAFCLFGESVESIRLVQSALYLAAVLAGCAVAWRMSAGNRAITRGAGLLLAVPPVLVALYSTATLGGYGETLLLGALLLWLGFRLVQSPHPPAPSAPGEGEQSAKVAYLSPQSPPHPPTPDATELLPPPGEGKQDMEAVHALSRRGRVGEGEGLSPTPNTQHRTPSFSLTPDPQPLTPRWLALGLCAGLGWWTNNLIVAYALPVAVYLLISIWQHHREADTVRRALIGIGVALLGFFVGSAPWWAYNLQNGFPSLGFLFGGSSSALAGMDTFNLPLGERLIGTFLLGLPTVFGVRFPWQSGYLFGVVALLVVGIVIFACVRFVRRPSALLPGARGLLLGMIVGFLAVFAVSRFSIDPTGRYFLPLALPFAIVLACSLGIGQASSARRQRIPAWVSSWGLLSVLVVYQVAGQIAAVAQNPPGMTTQFNLQTHLPNENDAALIEFLESRGLTRGYTSYWVAFRLAFLSEERLIYRAVLPYKSDLTYTAYDERYPPYVAAVDEAVAQGQPLAIISPAVVPEVTAALVRQLAAAGATYQQERIGGGSPYGYDVFYDIQPPEAMPHPLFPWVNR